MQMIRKGQMEDRIAKGLTAAEQFDPLAAQSLSRQGELIPKRLHPKFATKPRGTGLLLVLVCRCWDSGADGGARRGEPEPLGQPDRCHGSRWV